MLRASDQYWMKCGIEYVDGIQQASAVVTNDFSDWSVTPLQTNPARGVVPGQAAGFQSGSLLFSQWEGLSDDPDSLPEMFSRVERRSDVRRAGRPGISH